MVLGWERERRQGEREVETQSDRHRQTGVGRGIERERERERLYDYYLSCEVKLENECISAFKVRVACTNLRYYLYPRKLVIITRFYHHIWQLKGIQALQSSVLTRKR